MDTRRKDLVIYEIQTYLRELYKEGEDIPLITPDGIYGELTAEAVRAFQRSEEIPDSGNVDFITWERLTLRSKAIRAKSTPPESISPFDMLLNEATSTRGDSFDLICITQIMLRALHTYDYLHVEVSGKLDEATSDALRDFSSRNEIYNPDGELNKEVWNALATAYSLYILKNPGE
jgi:peptidoglycan hydrolase-like protein with peptidoglycan-binding domain